MNKTAGIPKGLSSVFGKITSGKARLSNAGENYITKRYLAHGYGRSGLSGQGHNFKMSSKHTLMIHNIKTQKGTGLHSKINSRG